MRIPLEVGFHKVETTPELEQTIEERADRLSRYYRGIISCRVVVEAPHRSPNEDALGYRVRVEVTIPGGDLVASRDSSSGRYEEHDPYFAVRDAFNAIEKQLKSRTGRRRRGRHHRTGPPHAVVNRLFADEDYGFLQTGDGRDIYFHRNSVINDGFDNLQIGQEVRFEEAQGLEGPQASTVKPIGQHGTRVLS